MVVAYYLVTLLASFVLLIAYLAIWHKHFDIHITLIFVIVPVANVGCSLVAFSQTLEAALVATKISYIGGCYLILILMLAVFGLCGIKLNRWIRVALFGLSTVVYLSVLTVGSDPIYYVSTSMEFVDGVAVLHKQYGPIFWDICK